MRPQRSHWSKFVGWFSPFLSLGHRFSKERQASQDRIDDAWTPLPHGEIKPPWIAFPEYPPGDFFWREAGEAWWVVMWEPYYSSLNETQQAEYRKRWEIPEIWWKYHFDPAWREWLEHVDDDEPNGTP